MASTELIRLEELQGKFLEEILEGTGIESNVYSEYRDGKREIP